MQQYGMRLRDELPGMTFSEFEMYLYALNDETPLGKLVSVRTERDPERLKQFTPEMNRIRADWMNRKASKTKQMDRAAEEEMFKSFFLQNGKVVNKGENHAG